MFHRSIIRVIRIFGNSGSVPNPTRISGDSHIAASQVNEFTPIGSARVSSPSGHVRVRAGSREYVAACGRGAGAAQRGMVGGGEGDARENTIKSGTQKRPTRRNETMLAQPGSTVNFVAVYIRRARGVQSNARHNNTWTPAVNFSRSAGDGRRGFNRYWYSLWVPATPFASGGRVPSHRSYAYRIYHVGTVDRRPSPLFDPF